VKSFKIGLLLGFCFCGLGVFAQYRAMELTPSVGMSFSAGDYQPLKNLYSYSLIYSYWLTDTSTLDLWLKRIEGEFDFELFSEKQSLGEKSAHWSMTLGGIGFRYQPEWDFFLDAGLGAGIGYQAWESRSDYFSTRHGEGMLYYALFDLEYPATSWLSLGIYFQPFYFPLDTRMERAVYLKSAGSSEIVYDKIKDGWIFSSGIWLAIKIR